MQGIDDRGRVGLGEAEFVERESREGFVDEWESSLMGGLYLNDDFNADLRRPILGALPGGRIRPSWYAGFG